MTGTPSPGSGTPSPAAPPAARISRGAGDPDPRAADGRDPRAGAAPHPRAEVGSVWARYAAYLRAPPELAFEWHDPESPARGWLVINSLKGGAAGGGTRMRRGLTRDEVVYLAKLMELKFAFSGPTIGGAKAGIDFPPDAPAKANVLRRWFRTVRGELATRWGTAGDLNVDEVREVLPFCRELGLGHPQQGVLCGHLGLSGEVLERRVAAMNRGLEQPVDGGTGLAGSGLRVLDLVTGAGVASAALHALERDGRDPRGSRALVEGFGCVGGAAALYLARAGVRIVGIRDAHSELVAEEGLGVADVEDLLRRRTGNRIPVEADGSPRKRFWTTHADLFVAAAASETIDGAALDRLEELGVRTIACGANRPFRSEFPGDTRLEQTADSRFAVIPDIVANCGAAHAFARQIRSDAPLPPEEIFASVREVVTATLDATLARAGDSGRGLLAGALDLALERCGRYAGGLLPSRRGGGRAPS